VIDHVSITVPDLASAARFYDAVMAALGIPAVGHDDTVLRYGKRCDAAHPDRSYLTIRPGPAPGPDEGRHWCFKAPSRPSVDGFWRAGLATGGVDGGTPGLRPHYHPHYYAAFLRDPGGNRIEAVCHEATA
jgi:catechol 2,3-dioxygenase-like lactoylglutathione lyase family enzyme